MDDLDLPLSARQDAAAAEKFRALLEGVPPHLIDSLLDWMRKFLPEHTQFRGEHERLVQTLLSLENELHREIPGRGSDKREGLIKLIRSEPDYALTVVDWFLRTPGYVDHFESERLEEVLRKGGSAWTAHRIAGRSGLVRRLEPSVVEALRAALVVRDNASTHLETAWTKAFGHGPDAASAFHEAVKALEAAFQPIVSPKDPKATLGTITDAIAAKPAKFRTRLDAEAPEDVMAVRNVLRAIWKSDVRHGSGMAGAPTSPTIEEARDAVVLAVSLVQLVRQGGFALGGD